MKLLSKISQGYFNWLSEMVDGMRNRELLLYLHRMNFYSTFPHDDNRAADGERLRSEFEFSKNADVDELIGQPCSILEMLIALSIRLSDLMYVLDEEVDIPKWFWLLIDNLGLTDNYQRNDVILRRFLERRYSPNGKGGLFPLRNPRSDQTEVEIWYQMQEYVQESS